MNGNKQFFIVPNDMTTHGEIKPTDILVYLYLRSYDNPEHKCFPSLATLSNRNRASINTIRTEIRHLEENGYITVKKISNKNYYYFSKEKEFQIFSPDFLNNDTLTFKEKAYIASTQQYMFKDVEGLGKISMPDTKLVQMLNVSEKTLYRWNKSLMNKELLIEETTKVINKEPGCYNILKTSKLGELGQAIFWQIKKNTEDIKYLKDENDALRKTCNILIREVEKLKEQQHEQLEITL